MLKGKIYKRRLAIRHPTLVEVVAGSVFPGKVQSCLRLLPPHGWLAALFSAILWMILLFLFGIPEFRLAEDARLCGCQPHHARACFVSKAMLSHRINPSCEFYFCCNPCCEFDLFCNPSCVFDLFCNPSCVFDLFCNPCCIFDLLCNPLRI